MTEKTPLFSTYTQGENRVTASMLAVFERIDSGHVAQLLTAATGESSLEWVQYQNQVAGKGSVPDAGILGAFHYLFEVKVKPQSVGAPQLRAHLECFRDHVSQRLFVVTPDPVQPPEVGAVNDPRVVWLSFAMLDQAIDELLTDPSALVSEHDRLLLTELRALFVAEELLDNQDAVVVAARIAYPDYAKTHAYVCQPGRSFRPGLRYLGFYAGAEIKPEIPAILHNADDVIFSQDNAAALLETGRDEDRRVGEVILTLLDLGRRMEGSPYQVFVLSGPESQGTIRRESAIKHVPDEAGGKLKAWTQGQRYARSDKLRVAQTTRDL